MVKRFLDGRNFDEEATASDKDFIASETEEATASDKDSIVSETVTSMKKKKQKFDDDKQEEEVTVRYCS